MSNVKIELPESTIIEVIAFGKKRSKKQMTIKEFKNLKRNKNYHYKAFQKNWNQTIIK